MDIRLTLSDLGQLLARGEYAAMLQRCSDLLENPTLPVNYRVLLLDQKIKALTGLNRVDEAIATCQEELPLMEQLFDPEHPHVANILHNLSMYLGASNRHEEALPDEDGWITALQDEDFDKGPFEGPSLSLRSFKESLWRARLRDYEKEWKLTGDQMAVLSEVLKDPSISISAMSRATGLSRHLVGRQLASMEALGLLAREGRTWHVAPRTRKEGND